MARTVTLRLSDATYEAVKRYAEADQQSMNSWIEGPSRRRGHAAALRGPRPVDGGAPRGRCVRAGVGRSQPRRAGAALSHSPRRGEVWTTDAGASVLVISSTVYNEIATEPTVVVVPMFDTEPDTGFGVDLDAGWAHRA